MIAGQGILPLILPIFSSFSIEGFIRPLSEKFLCMLPYLLRSLPFPPAVLSPACRAGGWVIGRNSNCFPLLQLEAQAEPLRLDAHHGSQLVLIALQLFTEVAHSVFDHLILPSPVGLGALLQRVHLGHPIVHGSLYFHQVHPVEGTLREIHHKLQLKKLGACFLSFPPSTHSHRD